MTSEKQVLSIFLLSHFFRSSRPEVFFKKGVLRNLPKLTGKHLCQILFFNKVAGLRPATLLKKGLWYRCFLVNFLKFLRAPFFIEHLWWLLLFFVIYVFPEIFVTESHSYTSRKKSVEYYYFYYYNFHHLYSL